MSNANTHKDRKTVRQGNDCCCRRLLASVEAGGDLAPVSLRHECDFVYGVNSVPGQEVGNE